MTKHKYHSDGTRCDQIVQYETRDRKQVRAVCGKPQEDPVHLPQSQQSGGAK